MNTEPLSDLDLQILQFEARWSEHGGRKEEAIRVTFGWRASRYYQKLNQLIDRPQVVAAEPALAKRLQRLRETRIRARRLRVPI